MTAVLEVRDLDLFYGDAQALDGVSIEADEGGEISLRPPGPMGTQGPTATAAPTGVGISMSTSSVEIAAPRSSLT